MKPTVPETVKLGNGREALGSEQPRAYSVERGAQSEKPKRVNQNLIRPRKHPS